MRSALLLVALGSVAAGVAQAEIYRCVQADGSVRFVGDPSSCEAATRQGLTREIQRFGDPPDATLPAGERPIPAAEPAADPGTAATQAAAPGQETSPPAATPEAGRTLLRSLEELYLPARAAGGSGHWEAVKEAPVEADNDPDFLRWGVQEKRVRHYTHRDATGRVRVCSVELWDFDSDAQARLARQNLSFPNWSFERRGSVLVMLHAVSRERGERASHGVFPECSRLGARIAARADQLSR